jgi:hypothetical protein
VKRDKIITFCFSGDDLELVIANLSDLESGRIFYSGKLYIVEANGAMSKARPWGAPVGTIKDCLALSPQSVTARFYPVVERAMVLPVLNRDDFLSSKSPTAYTLASEKDASRAAQLDCDLAVRCGLSIQRIYRIAAWLLTDGARPHRLYHYPASDASETAFHAYCAQHNFVLGQWPDERTPHWKLLFSP